MLGLRLRHLAAVGREKPTAKIGFAPGLNVIYGAANTGKTHILHLIDYALGSSSPPAPPPEQLGYEGILLGIESLDGRAWTLCRSLQGGDIRRLDGLHDSWPSDGAGEVLSATHRAANSLSKFLLDLLGMEDVRLRKNAKGELQDLSFRNIAHMVLVPEGKIQNEASPIETGQYVSKTVEFSLFKYMLTGIDDSSIQVTDRSQHNRNKIAAQLELLDAQIAEAEQAMNAVEEEREELGERHQRLEETVNTALQAWGEASVDYRTLANRRRTLRGRQNQFLDRQDEIELLLARFGLLSRHYQSDLSRLRAIEEAASIFGALEEGPCPWCGADARHRGEHAASVCEGDTDQITEAAHAEQDKICLKMGELSEIVQQLTDERSEIVNLLPSIDDEIASVEGQIREELPDIREAQGKIVAVISARDATQSALARYENVDRLKRMRSEMVGDNTDVDSVALIAEGGVDTTVLDEFSQTIERFLIDWMFPSQRVFFDLPRRDIQVAGKARRVNGKGVRAVLHSAFSLGLLQFTADHEKPHPRMLILDSPLVTYRDPLAEDEIQLAQSNLNERFYEPFRNWDDHLQVIIIENRDPPSWLSEIAKIERFTGAKFGRWGFYL